jgi:acetoin utilization protein AcuB
MTLVPHSIGKDQTLRQAKEMLAKHEIRHLPVCEGGKLLGVISERDIHAAVAIDHTNDDRLTVEDICMPEPFVVPPTMKLDAVVEEMGRRHLGCAVVEVKGKPVGIFTTVDACIALSQVLRGSAPWETHHAKSCC